MFIVYFVYDKIIFLKIFNTNIVYTNLRLLVLPATEDILWFKPVELWTKYGRRGHIKEALGKILLWSPESILGFREETGNEFIKSWENTRDWQISLQRDPYNDTIPNTNIYKTLILTLILIVPWIDVTW